MKSKSQNTSIFHPSFRPAGFMVLTLCLYAVPIHAADNHWTGAISPDWNDGANWSEGGVPDTSYGDNAVISTASPNIATITEDILSNPNDIIVRGGGRIDHRAGIAGTNGGAWMFVGQDGTPSFYNLADTGSPDAGITGFAQGSGTLNPTGNLQVASWAPNRNGIINIHTTGSVNIGGGLFIANDNGCIGTMNLESGAVIVSHSPGFATDNIQIGHNGGNGTLNISGGSLDASRNFRVGNEGGTGTLNITGGSITIGGTDDMFIGRDRGIGVVTQSGGIVDFNHNTFIGNGNNANANTSGTYNISDGVLNVKREFVIGREGDNATHTGTLNMTGGTITKTGDENMIVAQSKAKGTVVQSGGVMNVNNALIIGSGVSQQAQVTSILANANDGQLETRSEWAPGTVTVQDTGNWNVNVGEWYGSGLTTAVIPFKLPDFGTVADPFTSASFGVNLYNKGNATVTDLDLYAVRVSSSPQIATTDWYNGSEPDPNATLIQASFLTPASTTTSVGPESGPNNLTDAAGSAALLAYLNSAYNGGAGAGQFVFLRVSYGSDSFATGWDAYNFTTSNAGLEGDFPVINFTSSTAPLPTPDGSEGFYTLSGTGTLNVDNEITIGRENGTGTFNLDGGTVTMKKIEGGTGSATVNFNGGILRAKRDESNFIENLDVANVEGGGLRIDSNGFHVSTSQVLTGTGGLEKSGAGQLTLSGANAYAGTTTVAAGVLRIEKGGLNATVDADANTLVVEFTAQPLPGEYPILPGPLAGDQIFSASGLGVNQLATFDNLTSTVTVTGGSGGDSYLSWIDSFTPNDLLPDEAAKLPGADPDGDGITNLMEFVLGGSPVVASQSILPTLATVGADFVLSYKRSDESESVTTQVGQWSTDLTNWNDVTPVLVNENGALPDDMSITVPKSNELNGKLFLRLSVEMP